MHNFENAQVVAEDGVDMEGERRVYFMNGLKLSVFGHGGVEKGDGGFYEFVLLVDVADVEVNFGPLVEVLHVVQDDVGLH